MIARPALPAVLAALTDLPVEVWTARAAQHIVVTDRAAGAQRAGGPVGFFAVAPVPWTTTDPAEAWEILDARGLLPPEGTRGFWCTPCDSGRSDRGFMGCPACALTGNRRAPATIPDLVAWASLGADAIVTAEALCREIAPALAPPCYDVDRCERVVWRVGDARRSPGFVAKRWTTGGGDSALVFTAAETIAPVRALWGAGLALERVGAECVLCVPPIGGVA